MIQIYLMYDKLALVLDKLVMNSWRCQAVIKYKVANNFSVCFVYLLKSMDMGIIMLADFQRYQKYLKNTSRCLPIKNDRKLKGIKSQTTVACLLFSVCITMNWNLLHIPQQSLHTYFMLVHVNLLFISVCDCLSLWQTCDRRQTNHHNYIVG